MENIKTLIVNYFGMSAGGVEKYIANLMRYCVKNGHRVIWFTTEGVPENAKQSGIVGNPGIEIIKFPGGRRKFFGKMPNLNLHKDENVVMISFVPEDYIWAEQFRYKYNCESFYHHFILMNFFGFLTYPEDEFKTKFISNQRAKFSYKVAHQFENNKCIHAFALKQLESYKNRYDLSYNVSRDLCLKSFPPAEGISENELKEKAHNRNKEFKIVSCARFQFPHKGYILGLLDEFTKLKEKYAQVELIVIGDGERETFYSKYDELPEKVKKSIYVKGTIPFESVEEIFRKSHLNIGLAGSIISSASIGLPSLVVRHDTVECETYGLYQKAGGTLNEKKGEPVFSYIENLITCDDYEYIRAGIDARNLYLSNMIIEPDYILKAKNKSSKPVITKNDFMVNKLWAMISLSKKFFKNL